MTLTTRKSAPKTACSKADAQPAAKSRTRKTPAALAAQADLPSPTPARKLPTGKLGVLVDLLQRDEGATLAAMMEATGWQAHSVRGAMAGTLKKKLGLAVTSTKDEACRTYRIAAAEPAQ